MSERGLVKTSRWVLMSVVLAMTATGYGQSAGKGTVETPPPSPAAQAQAATQPEPQQEGRLFQLTFVARELDEGGKVLNSRRFETMVLADSPKGAGISQIRTGAKIPVSAGSASNYTYMDVGANFDVTRSRIVKGNRLAMGVSVEISSLDTSASMEGRPTIRQNKWMGDVEIPIGGRKVIFSSDDLSSKKTIQIELTVTPVVER